MTEECRLITKAEYEEFLNWKNNYKLKPCPFCGNEVRLNKEHNIIQCDYCNMSFYAGDGLDIAYIFNKRKN